MLPQSEGRQADPIRGRPQLRFTLADMFWFVNGAAIFVACLEWLPPAWVLSVKLYVALAISLFVVGALRLAWRACRGVCAERRRTQANCTQPE